MIIYMRTTLVLDDDLVRQVKQRAAQRKLTVSEVVNEALREFLKRPAGAAPPFSMVTYGRSARTAHHEPSDFAAVLDNEDRARLR
jgi:Xaa-Pro aminopeptidase